MGAIEDTRKVLQDFLAPEIREIKTRLDALEKRMDERFDASERMAHQRHDAVMIAINGLANYNEVKERLTKLEAAKRKPSISNAILRAFALEKTYPPLQPGGPSLKLFQNLDLEVAAGEMVAIVGESGAGKSSLLHILAALDKATSGEVWCSTTEVTRLSGRTASTFRNREVGYVWQFHYLLPEFTAVENVAMPLLARGVAHKQAIAESTRWLERVGLADRAEHRSGELSGGEQQRVSIARALVTRPKLLLADEPTGDLDNNTAERVFALLQDLQREHSLAGVLVTHNADFAARCDRVLRLRGGALTTA